MIGPSDLKGAGRDNGNESTYKVVSLEIARPDVKALSRNVRAGRTEERERGNKVYGGRYNGVGTVCGHRIMAVYSMSSKIAFSNRYLEGIPCTACILRRCTTRCTSNTAYLYC